MANRTPGEPKGEIHPDVVVRLLTRRRLDYPYPLPHVGVAVYPRQIARAHLEYRRMSAAGTVGRNTDAPHEARQHLAESSYSAHYAYAAPSHV
jgi:hypothetical protein